MAKTRNSAPADGTHNDLQQADRELVSQFTEEEQLGFPPYWKSAVGKGFIARVLQLDDSDPDFQRWVFEALHPMKCARGPVSEMEDIDVKAGEYFSVSAYAQFGNNESGRGLHAYIGEVIKIECVGTQDTGQPNLMYVHKVHVTKETKTKLLAARRAIVDAKLGPKTGLATSPPKTAEASA